MNGLCHFLILLLSSASWTAMAAQEDWRLQLLKEEGISADENSLNGVLSAGKPSEALFLECVAKLGSEDFAIREQAEKSVLRMGKSGMPWLGHMPPSNDPEIRFRLARIVKELALEREWTKDELIRYAAESLLKERKVLKSEILGGIIFAELFRDESKPILGTYRGFHYRAEAGFTAEAFGGVLRMIGKIPNEGDQELAFHAKTITGKETFPDSFQVEVMLGGGAEASGMYHVGASIGNVRALFHPGYQGGGFRFERTDTHKAITSNTDMGFTPKHNELQLMTITLKRVDLTNLEISLAVSAGNSSKRFTSRTLVGVDVIGKITAISLDRSGQAGGDGIFDNLVIRLPER